MAGFTHDVSTAWHGIVQSGPIGWFACFAVVCLLLLIAVRAKG